MYPQPSSPKPSKVKKLLVLQGPVRGCASSVTRIRKTAMQAGLRTLNQQLDVVRGGGGAELSETMFLRVHIYPLSKTPV